MMLPFKNGVAYLMNNVIISWGNRDKKNTMIKGGTM
jgi:hypothetical protein